MSAGGYLDACGFVAASSGTGSFVVSSAITGYQTPASAGAVNATVYSYRAESSDKTQWEEGFGAYTVSTTTLARSTITTNSSGGATAINFSSAPNVFITALSADLQNASLLNSGSVPTAQLTPNLAPLIRSYLAGLTLSTAGSSAAFSVAAGVAIDSTNVDLLTLAASISKTTSAWAVGSGNGGLDTGSIAASTWYHVWLIKRTDTGVVDVLASLSATAPTMPTSYTEKRRIGSMKTNGSSQWTSFSQLGDQFLWAVPINDEPVVSVGTTATSFTLTVPTGVQVEANINAFGFNTANWAYLLTSLDQTDTAATLNALSSANGVANQYAGSGPQFIRTNTSAQIRARASAASTQINITTFGWRDTRGRDN